MACNAQSTKRDEDDGGGGGSCQFRQGARALGHNKSLRKVFQPHPDPLLSGCYHHVASSSVLPCSLSTRQIRRKPVNNSVPQWLGSQSSWSSPCRNERQRLCDWRSRTWALICTDTYSARTTTTTAHLQFPLTLTHCLHLIYQLICAVKTFCGVDKGWRCGYCC